MRFEKRKVGYSVRDDLDLASRHVMNGTKQFAALFRHDDDLRRSIDDLAHHVVLGRRRLGEHGMKRRDDRHFEPRQELDDIAAGLAAENSILVLKGDDVEARIVQKFGGLNIFVDHFVVNLKAHGRRIVIGAAGIGHGDDAGLQIRAIERDRPMQIVGEGCDAAAARKMIADECNALKLLHCVLSSGRLRRAAFLECAE